MTLNNAQYEEVFHKIESFSKNANDRVRYLAQHINDNRGSEVDRMIQAEVDFTFAIKHYQKIIEMLQIAGNQLGIKP